MKWMRSLSLLLLVVLMAAGCVQNYRVTQPLEQPLNHGAACELTAITDALPQDFKEEDKPSTEFISKLGEALRKELKKVEAFPFVSEYNPEAEYELTGSILDYKKGSGFLRFLFGAFAGGSKLTVELSLTDRASGSVIFAGNFSQAVTGWAEASDATCTKLAKDFAKAVKKQMKELEKKG